MSLTDDGQAKCDRCGKLDGTSDNKMLPGWKRDVDPRNEEGRPPKYPDRHYCPDCSKEPTACIHCGKISYDPAFWGWYCSKVDPKQWMCSICYREYCDECGHFCPACRCGSMAGCSGCGCGTNDDLARAARGEPE